MQTRILKECRALAPMWIVAVLLVVGPVLFDLVEPPLWFPCLALGAVLLSVATFGKEFALGTYSPLLAQPVSRWRLWWEKTLVLGVALGSLWLIVLVILAGYVPERGRLTGTPADLAVLIAFLIVLAAYGGGVCLTLLLRQANGAFWLALLLPVATGLAVNWIMEKVLPHYDPALIWTLTVIGYSAAAYGIGLWLFLKREDVGWLTGEVTISLRSARPLHRTGQLETGRLYGPMTALVFKELHLQQVNILCGLLLVPLFFGVVLAERLPGVLFENLKLADVLRGFYFMLWALLPFLIGAASIVEERRLGLLEWQQSLPVSRHGQYRVKLFVACGVSFILATLLPWMLETAALFWALPTPLEPHGGQVFEWQMLLPLAVAAPLATLVGTYASSLTRNLLHALSLVIGLIAVTWALFGLFLLAYEFAPIPPWQLLILLGLTTALVVLVWLAFRNYCDAALGARLWRNNLAVLLVTCLSVFGLTAALYARAWEVCLPGPRLGNARLTGPATPKIVAPPGPLRLLVLLPTGTLWQWNPWAKPRSSLTDPPTPLGEAGAWKDVAATSLETVGIRTDGTLWRWNLIIDPERQSYRETEPEQIGTDHDWRSVAAGSAHFAALKADGSLWKWEPTQPARAPTQGRLGVKAPEEQFDHPTRNGTDADWLQVAAAFGKTLAVKRDGSAWEWDDSKPVRPGVRAVFGARPPPSPKGEAAKPEVRATPEPRVRFGPPPVAASEDLPRWRPPHRIGDGTNWVSITVGASDYTYFGIQSDGSLWFLYRALAGPGSPHVPEPARIGTDADWLLVSYAQRLALGIKKDGNLWSAEAPAYPSICLLRSGTEGDFKQKCSQGPWIAVEAAPLGSAFALAADGSLWTWGWPLEGGVWLIPPSNRPHLVARLAELESR